MLKGLKDVKILTPLGYINGNIEIKDKKIYSINEDKNFKGISFDEEVIVVPGFVDEHIHGANASDTMDATPYALLNISKTLAKEGTTSFLATTMTQSRDNIDKALKNVKKYIDNNNNDTSEILGIHLEGPFLNPLACGAQPKEYIVNPNVEEFKRYHEISGNNIKFLTIAPEFDGAEELIKYCKKENIIASVGHTLANYDETLKAIKNGATHVTHCYNAMTPLHHRKPGVVGAVMLHNELMAEMIVDGIHINPKSVEIMYKAKGKDNITLITDSMRAKWLDDGQYELGGQDVIVKSGEARLVDGTLAGSVLKMIDAIKNMINFTNISLEEAILMASTNPAKKLNVYDRKGSIEVGKDADLVVLNKDYEILMTICRGELAFKK